MIGDGLSAAAVQGHALPLLLGLRQALAGRLGWAPLLIATQARVALGDEIGALLKARLVLVLIGERPGLSSPDSLGAYLTYEPALGRSDAQRNCVSNVRPQGLTRPLGSAAHRLAAAGGPAPSAQRPGPEGRQRNSPSERAVQR